jgi:hypothetical protein
MYSYLLSSPDLSRDIDSTYTGRVVLAGVALWSALGIQGKLGLGKRDKC